MKENETNMTQEEVARALGLSVYTTFLLLHGQQKMSRKAALRLADQTGISPCIFMFGSGEEVMEALAKYFGRGIGKRRGRKKGQKDSKPRKRRRCV